MTMPVRQKIRYSLILTGIAVILTIPDVLFDLTVDLFHTSFDFFLESMHTLFESVEYVLDFIVEHLFHTERETTQLIVFYIMIAIGLGLLHGALKLTARFYRYCKKLLFSLWVEEQALFSIYWLNLSLINKIKVIAVISGLAYLFFLVSF